jgi:hypothetical protein
LSAEADIRNLFQHNGRADRHAIKASADAKKLTKTSDRPGGGARQQQQGQVALATRKECTLQTSHGTRAPKSDLKEAKVQPLTGWIMIIGFRVQRLQDICDSRRCRQRVART